MYLMNVLHISKIVINRQIYKLLSHIRKKSVSDQLFTRFYKLKSQLICSLCFSGFFFIYSEGRGGHNALFAPKRLNRNLRLILQIGDFDWPVTYIYIFYVYVLVFFKFYLQGEGRRGRHWYALFAPKRLNRAVRLTESWLHHTITSVWIHS